MADPAKPRATYADLLAVPDHRVAEILDDLRPLGFELPPDRVGEVVSPSTASVDRVKKMRIYAREGVTNVWLIEPLQKTLEAYRLEQGRWILLGAWSDDARARIEPFEANERELDALRAT